MEEAMVTLKKSKHSVGQNSYHFVWRPKYNISVFADNRYREYMTRLLKIISEKWDIQIYEMEIMPDHIHMFVEIPPMISVSFAFQILKGTSSFMFFRRFQSWKKYFHKGHEEAYLWSPGKFFRSIGAVTSDVVERYIRRSNEWKFNINRKKKR